ncbi:MAG: discoidin domain-containing protein [Candidatus Zipacnadales bacterium]
MNGVRWRSAESRCYALGLLVLGLTSAGLAAEAPVYSHKANVLSFEPQQARFVRFVIRATNSGNQACLDELEVYPPGSDENLALAAQGAKASASSLLGGYRQHAVEHLNDGEYGNAHSWIAATSNEEWAQIELPKVATIARVVFSRDRLREYGDRVPTSFAVQLSLDAKTWKTVREVQTIAISGVTGMRGKVPPLPSPPPPPRRDLDGRLIVKSPDADATLTVPQWDEQGFENLALRKEAKAAASSVYADGALAIHQIKHLNDGLAGNSHSWISKGEPSWAEVDLGDIYWIYHVALGNDASGHYRDRAMTHFSILTALDRDTQDWHVAYRCPGTPLLERTEFRFRPVQARFVRIAIQASAGGEARLDELEVYGQREKIAPDRIGPLTNTEPTRDDKWKDLLRYAFLSEEHAWLKTYGRADLDPALVPYNGRVKEYPRHVGDDRLPLPPLSVAPKLDGSFEEACWHDASQGIVRVAHLADFDAPPLVEHTLQAGRYGRDLYLRLQVDRLLSSHLAVVSSGDWQGCGVVVLTPEGFVFNTYRMEGYETKLDESRPLAGVYSTDLTCFEWRLPLSFFPECEQTGIRVGLGLGGRHTAVTGRPIYFAFSPLGIRQVGPCVGERFVVKFSLAHEAPAMWVTGEAEELDGGFTLQPGMSKTVAFSAERGPIGPERNLSVIADDETYELHLFRYLPLERTVTLMTQLVERLEAQGLDVEEEHVETERFGRIRSVLLSEAPQRDLERQAFFEARLAKRRLFLRVPDLEPIERLLFVKRHAYHPSHIYTDYTDAPFRPGGGVYRIEIPRIGGRFEPGKAKLICLFESANGIARDPVADFDLLNIYFGYRASAEGFYHLMRMDPDGDNLQQITDGPYHDFYPCPLPDGGVAFISTRCAARVFCFRWTASVLFRMNADGSGMRPLSYASLNEWAPSLMRDGRIIWTRWEYIDKGADFSQTLWSINPDGTNPELVFGNTIIQPNGYVSGQEVPGTDEICCTLVSHFGDLNGPIALLTPSKGRFNPRAIKSLTPEVPWPGMWPSTECFRDPVPLARDYFLCSHAPQDRFGLYIIDRYGNRELLYLDDTFGSMAPTPFRKVTPPPVYPELRSPKEAPGILLLFNVYQGLEPTVQRGTVKWLRVVEEVRHNLGANPNFDHTDFMKWYASPVDLVSGPFGWPSYVAKAPLGLVPVAKDGSAYFKAPAGRVLYFQALDKDFNELQRMRSVVQLQPGEMRSCIGCHEPRNTAPPLQQPLALGQPAAPIVPHSFGNKPFSYERVVQPVLDAKCVTCHDGSANTQLDLRGILDEQRVPASYRSLIQGGWVHFIDCGWNSGGCEKKEPLTFGTVKSRLWQVLKGGHYDVKLTPEEELRIKTWTDLNCPLWPDYIERSHRPDSFQQVVQEP